MKTILRQKKWYLFSVYSLAALMLTTSCEDDTNDAFQEVDTISDEQAFNIAFTESSISQSAFYMIEQKNFNFHFDQVEVVPGYVGETPVILAMTPITSRVPGNFSGSEPFALSIIDKAGNNTFNMIQASLNGEPLSSSFTGEVLTALYKEDGEKLDFSMTFEQGNVQDYVLRSEDGTNTRCIRRSAYCAGKQFEEGGGIFGGPKEWWGCYRVFHKCFTKRFMNCFWEHCFANDLVQFREASNSIEVFRVDPSLIPYLTFGN